MPFWHAGDDRGNPTALISNSGLWTRHDIVVFNPSLCPLIRTGWPYRGTAGGAVDAITACAANWTRYLPNLNATEAFASFRFSSSPLFQLMLD
jgi:hypothetical protein